MLKRYRHTLILALTTLLVSAPAALAADAGDIDLGFGSSGKVITDLRSSEQTEDVAVQSDGKIIVAGSWGAPLRTNFSLVRYNADGSRDSSFGNAGWVLADFDGDDDSASAVVVQPDGKILAVGSALYSEGTRFALARYDADGELDDSFSQNGLAATRFPESARATAVALTPGGKIVVVGTSFRAGGGGPIWAVARYDSDGTLDDSFSDDGILTTDFGGSYNVASGVAVQADGKIVAVGHWTGPGRLEFLVARYTTGGKLDSSFNEDGFDTPQFSSPSQAVAKAVVIQPDGRIVAAGYSKGTAALARYTTTGELDTTFDRDGLAFHGDFGLDSFTPSSLALQDDGKIVLAGLKHIRYETGTTDSGYQYVFNVMAFAIARYRASGTPDSGFGSEGMLTTELGESARATAVAIQPSGKIVAAGLVHPGPPWSVEYDIGLVRYHPITDNVDPQVIFDSGPTGTTNDPTPTFTFHSTKPGSSFECAIAGRPYVDCSSPYTAATLRNGVHNFRVVASDQSGNYSQVAVRSFRLDTTATPAPDPVQPVDDPPAEDVVAPDAPSPAPPAPTPEPPAAAPDAAPAAVQPTIIAGPTGKLEKRRVSFRFEVAGSAGATFECKLDASPWRACTSPQAYGQLSLGRHLFQVRVNDADGSGEAIPAKRRFRVVAH